MRNALPLRSICSFTYPFNEGHEYLVSKSDSTCYTYPHACPCGFYGDPMKECSCSAIAIFRYQKKISGPLLDRIDIHVEVPRVDYEKLADRRNVEDSKTIRARVQAARERQLERFKGTKWTCNAEMGPTEVRQFCQTDASGEKLLKLARAIADLAGVR